MASLEHSQGHQRRENGPICVLASGLLLSMVLKHHCTIDSPTPGHHRYSPLFQSVCYATLGFHERPTLLPVFANRKKSEDFHFYGKIESEIAFSVFFSKPFYRGSVHQSNESGPTKLLSWEPHSPSQHQAICTLS